MKNVINNQGLQVFQSALFKTNSTILYGTDYVIVVDPNWLPQEVDFLKKQVEKKCAGKDVYLFFTHSDYDHIIGYGAFPDAQVIASKALVENKNKEKTIEEILKFDDDYYLDRSYPIVYPKVDIVLSEEMGLITINQMAASYLLAPGHNPDGAMLYLPDQNVVVLGDYLSDVEFPFVYHSFEAYRSTLSALKNWGILNDQTTFIPGHGNPFSGLEELHNRIKTSFDYMDELFTFATEGKPFDEASLWKHYAYKRNQEVFHQANLSLLQKELGKK